MARNSNNNELYLHDHTSTYSIAKVVFRNQSYNTGTAKNHLFSGTFTERFNNVLKMPRSRYVFSFRNSRGKVGVHNPLTPGKYAVYFTFSSRRKTWLNSALSLVKRKFYQTINVRKISRAWLVFPLRKSQGQLDIYHQLTEGKCAVRVTFSSTWKTGLNSSFSLVNRNFTTRLMSWKYYVPDSFFDFG